MPLFTTTIPPKEIGVGQVLAVTLTTAGSGYTTAPAVTFNIPFVTTQATITATTINASGQVTGVTIGNAGAGYPTGAYGPIVAPVTFSAAPSGGVTATGAITVNASGQVTGVAITNPGSGYTAAPTATIAAPKSGQATGTATINATGQVTGVVITNPGFGYTAATPATVTFAAAPTGGTTAVGTVAIKEINISQKDAFFSQNPASAGNSVVLVTTVEAQSGAYQAAGIITPGWYRINAYVDSSGRYRVKSESLATLC